MLRLATPEERKFYEEEMYPLQDEILSLINTDKIYLTGGTCLSRFHYRHRYSDDLDFFYDAYRFPKEDFDSVFDEFIRKISSKFKLEEHRNYDTFKRVIVVNQGIKLKLEFVLEHLPTAAPVVKTNNFYIDSKINVGANKITTVYGRKALKDYTDLFFILKEFSLAELIKLSETKIVPLDYEGAIMALQGGAFNDEVKMIKSLENDELLVFITELQKKLIEYAKTIS